MATPRIRENERCVHVITVTPFTQDGRVDFDSARQMVDFICGFGTWRED